MHPRTPAGRSSNWFTPSIHEWYYLLQSRSGASQKRGYARIYVAAKNQYINGLVVLPDAWTLPSGCTFNPSAAYFETNTYNDTTTWPLMEAAGAMFLPAAGGRNGYLYSTSTPTSGSYWSSSISRDIPNVPKSSGAMSFVQGASSIPTPQYIGQMPTIGRCAGELVRLAIQ